MTEQTNHFHDNSSLVKLPNSSFPVDNSWIDDVVQLEQNLTICETAVQAVDTRRDAQTVHPVTIRYHRQTDKQTNSAVNITA